MAKKDVVHCRICKQEINKSKEVEGKDWILRSRGWYYHCSCYNNWILKKDDIHTAVSDEELWKDASYQFLLREHYIQINYNKFDRQWQSYIKNGKTPKGIYFSLKYFYDIQKGNREKAQEGIGIVQYIYNDAREYWSKREQQDRGIINRIEQQIKQKEQQTKQAVVVKNTTKNKKVLSLEEIEGLED